MDGEYKCVKCGKVTHHILYGGGYCANCHKKRLDDFITEHKTTNENSTIFQYYIYNNLKYNCLFKNFLTRKEVVSILIRAHLPKKLHNTFLSELEGLGFIRQEMRNRIKIL